ncbi:ISNCY family transposase [Salmonella enterica subsp. enterica serovar Mississippi]|nr:ISNCY family transposase [Salmonella enterica subsp. enterica serovar Mississippi]
MTAHAAEFFTLDEVNRLKIIQDVVDQRLTTLMAAQRLGISDRQCRRLLSRYRESGPLGMANRRRGKPSNNQLPDGFARFVKSESTFTYFEATRGYLEKHGKPLALYSDKASVFRINNKNATGGDGYTQFGRAMHELNIQTICANTSSAKGRVERAHLTLQDRLVKERRLRGISSVNAANDFADEFMADYNRRFAKEPRHDFDVHRPLETDDDLAAFFTWREPRRVSKSLTVQYDKVLYLIEDSELSRRAIGKYIEVWHYPDGRKELRLNGVILPYSIYDRLQEIDQGAIVDNKRLGRTLDFIKLVQDKRDNNRSQAIPAGDGPSRRRRKPTGKKSQRSLNGDDMLEALNTLQSRSEEIFGKRK